MNISNINNFINVKNDILKCFANAVPQAMDVSVTVAKMSEANLLLKIY